MGKNAPPTIESCAIDALAVPSAAPRYVLRLYIVGFTSRAARAISNIRKICEEHLEGRYDLDIVDIAQHPALAGGEQIIAVPTLVKKSPLPIRRFIGDMSHTEHILLGLDLRAAAEQHALTTKS
jgi:circadian clock protein KaiB